MEQAQQEKTDQRRGDFFKHMSGFQERNDIKTKALSNYMFGKDLNSLAAQDEARYIRDQEAKNINDGKKADLNAQRNKNSKMNNLEALKLQMKEKEL